MAKNQDFKLPHGRGAGPAGAADNVHDRAKGHESASELRENVNVKSAPTASKSQPLGFTFGVNSAGSAGQQKSATEANHQPARRSTFRRLTESKAKKLTPADSASTASSQPVLVRAYPTAAPESAVMHRSRRQPPPEPLPSLPPLSSFSFQDILKEIDQEIQPSIDAIAEIFGRSKLSLADEYSSHLPPQGELSFPASQSQNEVLEAISTARLEPVEEVTPESARRQSLALVAAGATLQPKSGALAATNTASVESIGGSIPLEANGEADTEASLLPYVLGWLRNSNMRRETPSRRSSVDPRAADSLQKILGDCQASHTR